MIDHSLGCLPGCMALTMALFCMQQDLLATLQHSLHVSACGNF